MRQFCGLGPLGGIFVFAQAQQRPRFQALTCHVQQLEKLIQHQIQSTQRDHGARSFFYVCQRSNHLSQPRVLEVPRFSKLQPASDTLVCGYFNQDVAPFRPTCYSQFKLASFPSFPQQANADSL